MLLARASPRPTLIRAAAAFAGVLVAGLPPVRDRRRRARSGATRSATATGTYRILGYGLSALLLNAGVIDDRYGAYPFALLALLVWLPVTRGSSGSVRRSGRDWEAAAGFAVSIFVLLFIARVFQTSYLIWPLTGIAIAFLLAQRRSARPARRPASTRRRRRAPRRRRAASTGRPGTSTRASRCGRSSA